ncbi:MAG: glycosyltransferase family 2 protein [Solirubrobacteraceae bacterium]
MSVLTPVLNEEQGLDEVLERFRGQADPGGEIEFLFIDGGSTDDTRGLLERAAADDPRVHVLDNPRQITSAGLNVGLSVARGEFVARMDAHALYPPAYLRTGVDRLRRGDAAAVSGPQIAVGRDPWSRRIATALSTALGVGSSNFRRPVDREVETDSGFTGLWRRETVMRYGGWDELAYPNEDSELAARIRADGGRLMLIPGMAAEYTPRNSIASLWRQYWRYGRGRGRTARLHRNSIRVGHALCPALVLTVIGATTPIGPVRRPARRALLVYLSALLATAARVNSRRDAPYVPLVLVVMHVSWGAGYLLGVTTKRPALKPLG